MHNTAVEDLFLRETTLENDATKISGGTAKVTSGIRDWKRWGRDVSKDLGIAVWIDGAADYSAGSAQVTLYSGATEDACTTAIATATGAVTDTDKGGRLVFMLLPRTGIKQYVKVEVTTLAQFKTGTGTAATATAPTVSVGLDNDAENDIDLTMAQPKIG